MFTLGCWLFIIVHKYFTHQFEEETSRVFLSLQQLKEGKCRSEKDEEEEEKEKEEQEHG